MTDTALVQVPGAPAYGELNAHEGAKAAAAATDEAMGADPERAMPPYRT